MKKIHAVANDQEKAEFAAIWDIFYPGEKAYDRQCSTLAVLGVAKKTGAEIEWHDKKWHPFWM